MSVQAQRFFSRSSGGVLVLLASAILMGSESSDEINSDFLPKTCVRLEPTTTQVLIATVYLEVSPLCLVDGHLVGRYEIRVPLRPGKNEGGQIVLPVTKSFDDYLLNGGILKGLGYSDKEGQPDRLIECEIYPAVDEVPSDELSLVIGIGKRILYFKTDFEVIQDQSMVEVLEPDLVER